MKFRTTYALLGIVIIIGLLVLLTRGSSNKQPGGPALLNRPLYSEFTAGEAAKIELTRAGEGVTLEKRGADWWIAAPAEFPADAKGVKRLLDKVAALKPVELISTNPDKHALFEVGDKGLQVAISGGDGKPLAAFTIGKRGANFSSTYIRKVEADEVLLVADALKAQFDKQPKKWRDRTILSFDKETARQITIDDGVMKIVLDRDDTGAWHITEPEEAPASKAALDGLLATLSNFEAADFDDDATLESAGLDTPSASITVNTSEGQALNLHIGKAKDDRYTYARRGDRETVYLIFKGRAKIAMKNLEDLRAQPTAAAPPPPMTLLPEAAAPSSSAQDAETDAADTPAQ